MDAAALIAVDIGNSLTKVGWFAEGDAAGGLAAPLLIRDFPTGQSPPEELVSHLLASPVRWRVASVHRDGQRVLSRWVETHRPQDDFKMLTFADLPLEVRVDAPERVGLDRLAAVVAANVLREADRPAIVVDTGSAITVDLVSESGAFEGGVILAGLRMSAEALFSAADLLPLALLAAGDDPPPVVGKNTEAAIRSGLFWGAVGAVREIIEQMSRTLGQKPQIFVTGGELKRLTPLMNAEAQFVPQMVLSGIAAAARVQASIPVKGES